jgi:hypothetical protein
VGIICPAGHERVKRLNPAPLDQIISNVITEYRKSERHYSSVSVEQASQSGFGGGQSSYVSISLVCG